MKKRNRQFLLAFVLWYGLANAQEPPYDYTFFPNSGMSTDYFFSQVRSTGESSITHHNGRLPISENIFHSPGNALQLEYMNGKNGSWSVIISKPGIRGQDHFTTPNYLSFWLLDAEPANPLMPESLRVQLMRRDSSLTKERTFSIRTKKNWQEIIIPTTNLATEASADPENYIAVVLSQQSNDGRRHRLYLDDIGFRSNRQSTRPSAVPKLLQAKGYAKHIDLSWPMPTNTSIKSVKIYRSADGIKYVPVGLQPAFTNRYADYTGETGKKFFYKIAFVGEGFAETTLSPAAQASTRIMNDDEMMTMVQEASFRYYWEENEEMSGLAKENTHGRQHMIASGASGFGILALIVGTERKFIAREAAVSRFLRIVNFLDRAETFHGAYSHFIDGPTGKVEPFFGQNDNGGDLVETSFLVQGLLAARAYFDKDDPMEREIRDKITKIWKRIEWDWYRMTPDSKFLTWHWSPDKGWIINHQLIGWNETMVTYLLAIASPTHAVPASLYYSGWANQDEKGQQYRSAWGGTTDGSHYTNGNTYYGIKLDVGVSNGGPLFFTHYSYLGYDPHHITDAYTNYFTNNQHIAQINHRYCVENPGHFKGYGDSCWGLTASDGPFNYSADEPVLRQDRGKIGPTGAIASFPYTPIESMKALKNYYNNYGKFLWGEYGFRDAFNLGENWCSDIYMGLNQAPMTVMIENHRTGLIWRLFMSDPDVKAGLLRLAQARP